jgi:hypothetical protein
MPAPMRTVQAGADEKGVVRGAPPWVFGILAP